MQTVLIKVQEEFDLTKMRSETGTPYLIQRGRRFVDPRHMWGRYWPYRSTLIRQVGTSQWILAELSVAYHEIDNCTEVISECLPGKDYDVLTIRAVAPHEIISYIGSLSDEQPIVGVAEIPEVEGGADTGAEALVEEVGPVAAPQLEGVIARDEVVINDIVLKPTSSVRDLRAAAKYLGVSQAGSKSRMFENMFMPHFGMEKEVS